MRALQALITCLASIALAISLVGLGFVVCVLPPVTSGLSTLFSNDAASPFTRAQLTRVADATRDYSFWSHDLRSLYVTIYTIDREYADTLSRQGSRPQGVFPGIVANANMATVADFQVAFKNADDVYCFDESSIAHLDDCYGIARHAYPLIAVTVILDLFCLVWLGHRLGRRRVGLCLATGAIICLVVMVGSAIYALANFDSFFSTFHGIFFAQGSWLFSTTSLLICALPSSFWVGMVSLWVLISVILSVVVLRFGLATRRGSRLLRRRVRRT